MTKNYKIILVALLLAVYCFAFQGRRGLFEPDEGRYSAVALQMIKSNDWLIPRTHPQQEHWTKPPLTYWAIAGSMLVLGKSEFAVRFPNALSFLISILACFYLGKVFTPRRPWIVALAFGMFVFPATMCNGATTDFPVTMWETLAVCCFTDAYWKKKGGRLSGTIWLMWIFFGLAFLTKGPPGLLPLLSIVVFLRFKCSRSRNLPMRWLRGVFLMLLIGGSWYLTVIARDPDLAKFFLWDEIVLRLFSGHHQRHSQWYAFLYIYVPVLLCGTLPWTYYVVKGSMRTFQTAKQEFKTGGNERGSENIFLMLWFFIPMVIFIISRSNLPLYVLPLFVPLAIMAAREMERRGLSFFKIRYQIALWCVLIVLARPFMASLNFGKDSSRFAKLIHAKYPHPVEEIVFAGTRAALGLQFYTGSNIEQISMESPELENELNEKETRLWVVLDKEAEHFRTRIRNLDRTMIELGPIKAWNNYVLFAEVSDTINVRS